MRLWFRNSDSERLLLKRCFEGNAAAQQEFATSSYVGTIQRGVRLTLAEDYSRDHIERIATLCTFHIYKLWDTIPSATRDLHTPIRKAAIAFANNYRKGELRARKT